MPRFKRGDIVSYRKEIGIIVKHNINWTQIRFHNRTGWVASDNKELVNLCMK